MVTMIREIHISAEISINNIAGKNILILKVVMGNNQIPTFPLYIYIYIYIYI